MMNDAMCVEMFCFQCQEAKHGEGCQKMGVCGKTPEIAALQDLLVWQVKGLAYWTLAGRDVNLSDEATNLFVAEALFTTITNVNFDPVRLQELVHHTIELREAMRQRVQDAGAWGAIPEAATWTPANPADLNELIQKGMQIGLLASKEMNEDLRSLRELLIYGLKGLAAYLDHAYVLAYTSDKLLWFLQEGLVLTLNPDTTADEYVTAILKAGEMGVQAMALLDEANTTTYGHPEPTEVMLGVKPGPAILISGHDLRDLQDLLQQTEGTGVNVYTHGEMLPAHAYPAFKHYDHFVGNYGGAWWQQNQDFATFNGAILMTTNCMVTPRESYRDRIFTTGLVAYPDVQHIPGRVDGQPKDFSPVIEAAKANESPTAIEDGTVTIGFAHNTVLGVADKVLDAVGSGAIKRFVVMAGCDGRHHQRHYYTDLAQHLPEDHVILTAGCAKYRYNKLQLGDIGGIPRVLDAGQCNDSYSLVVIAQKLAAALNIEDINELPVSYDIAWYEQKAVIVLLALLHLGVKNIRLGPSLPAFVSPGVLDVLVNTFGIQPIGTVEQDLISITTGEW